MDNANYPRALQNLVRKFQYPLIKEYGFAPDDAGVNDMMEAMSKHMGDAKFKEQGEVIQNLLGLPNARAAAAPKSQGGGYQQSQAPLPKSQAPESFTKSAAMSLQ